MRKITLLTTAAAFATMFGVAALAPAADKPADNKAPATTQAAKDGPPVNKFCAVEGGDNKVDPQTFVIYKGQKVGFCCADCIKEFNKDPDKYVAKMK